MTNKDKPEKPEQVRITYSDKKGLTIELTPEGLESVALGATNFIEKQVGEIFHRPAVAHPMKMPAMPPVKKEKTLRESVVETGEPSRIPQIGLEETCECEAGLPELQQDIPTPTTLWQEPNHGGRALVPYEECEHRCTFVATDENNMLDWVSKILNYRKTHNIPWTGGGTYCADCLHRVK